MATDDVEADEELRELVAQTLETKGILSKIRAELRAHVFLALEEQEKSQAKQTPGSAKLKAFLSTGDGKLVASVLREFLEFFGLHYTASVFEPEAGAYELSGRDEILESLKIREGSDVRREEPVLAALVRKSSESSQTATISSSKLTSLLSGLGDPPPVHTVVDNLSHMKQSTSLAHGQTAGLHSSAQAGRGRGSSFTSPLSGVDQPSSRLTASGNGSSTFDAHKDPPSPQPDRSHRVRSLDWTAENSLDGDLDGEGVDLGRGSQWPGSLHGSGKQRSDPPLPSVDGKPQSTGTSMHPKESHSYEEDFVSERDGSSRRHLKTPDGATVDETLSHSEVTGDVDFIEPIKSS